MKQRRSKQPHTQKPATRKRNKTTTQKRKKRNMMKSTAAVAAVTGFADHGREGAIIQLARESLRERLERMRQMGEHMAQVQSNFAGMADLARDRQTIHSGPLHDVRDCRSYATHDPDPNRKPSRRPAHQMDRSTTRGRRRR